MTSNNLSGRAKIQTQAHVDLKTECPHCTSGMDPAWTGCGVEGPRPPRYLLLLCDSIFPVETTSTSPSCGHRTHCALWARRQEGAGGEGQSQDGVGLSPSGEERWGIQGGGTQLAKFKGPVLSSGPACPVSSPFPGLGASSSHNDEAQKTPGGARTFLGMTRGSQTGEMGETVPSLKDLVL